MWAEHRRPGASLFAALLFVDSQCLRRSWVRCHGGLHRAAKTYRDVCDPDKFYNNEQTSQQCEQKMKDVPSVSEYEYPLGSAGSSVCFSAAHLHTGIAPQSQCREKAWGSIMKDCGPSQQPWGLQRETKPLSSSLQQRTRDAPSLVYNDPRCRINGQEPEWFVFHWLVILYSVQLFTLCFFHLVQVNWSTEPRSPLWCSAATNQSSDTQS